MDTWVNFYQPHFANADQSIEFVRNLESQKPGDKKYRAMIMMHQAQRLVSLADDIAKIRPGKYSLQIMFLIICAENISKHFEKFDEEGKSKYFVRKFFTSFTSDVDKRTLEFSFKKPDYSNSTIDEIAEYLYTVRCDVVHEGKYWGFQLKEDIPMMNIDPDVNAHISYSELRNIIIRNCITAIQQFS